MSSPDEDVQQQRKKKKQRKSSDDEGSSTLRKSYTVDEDSAMLEFLEKRFSRNPLLDPLGNDVWKLAQRQNVTAHTFQSMRDRVRRVLLSQLKSGQLPEELLSESKQTSLLKAFENRKLFKKDFPLPESSRPNWPHYPVTPLMEKVRQLKEQPEYEYDLLIQEGGDSMEDIPQEQANRPEGEMEWDKENLEGWEWVPTIAPNPEDELLLAALFDSLVEREDSLNVGQLMEGLRELAALCVEYKADFSECLEWAEEDGELGSVKEMLRENRRDLF